MVDPMFFTRSFAGGNVRVQADPLYVHLILANGAVLPDEIGEAMALVEQLTGGGDSLESYNAPDDETGDEFAVWLRYERLAGSPAPYGALI